jgi:DNA polymerase I-like protein with 3'-5' exonuclease and polymerase domains
LLQFDLRRAIKESTFPELHLPQRLLKIDLSYEDIIDSLRQIRLAQLPVALDIEGGLDTMSCISFATMANFAFIVPFTRKDGTSVWSVEQECRILRELALTLEDPHVPKILQNAMYDTFVLQYSYHIRVRNVADDIMLKHWSLNAELRKSLALQASIYTREPYWKHERLQANDPQEKINAEENKEEGNDESEQ